MSSGCRSRCPNCSQKCWREAHLEFGDKLHTHGNQQEIFDDPTECNVVRWHPVVTVEVEKFEKGGWVMKRSLPFSDLYKLGISQDYWTRRGFETKVIRSREGTVRPLLPAIMTLLVRKIGPIRLELSCDHVAEVPYKHYNRELGSIICEECGKIADMAQTYVLPELK